jgi:transcriptional regulator with XRE-family HTH domain
MSSDSTAVRGDEQEWRALGERLREAREYLGLSQQEVSELLGVSRPAVSQMEAGRRKVSTLELRQFAQLYRRPYEWLVGESPLEEQGEDEITEALYRTTRELSERDRAQLLSFAQFLSGAGGPPPAPEDGP